MSNTNLNNKRELIILGTGNAMVKNCYNTCFLIRNQDEYMLVDGGGGNQIYTQLSKAKVSLKDIHTLYLTHAHTDHILGAVWVVRQITAFMKAGKYQGEFHIYGNQKAVSALRTICELTLWEKMTCFFDEQVFFHIMRDGESVNLLHAEFTVFDIGSTKEPQFGFSMIFEDGCKLTCLGDEPYAKRSECYALHSDVLMSEAFCLYADRDIYKPYEKHHSTAKDAAILASDLDIKNLILYHTEEDHLSNRKELYTKEAECFFKGTIYVPDDLDVITF